MTENQVESGRPERYRLPDDACVRCGSAAPPLSPGPAERIGPGVVRDTALCTACVRAELSPHWLPGRYRVEQTPPDDRGIRLWGIRDTHREDHAWVDQPGLDGGRELALFSTAHGAQGWIDRCRHMTEGRPRV